MGGFAGELLAIGNVMLVSARDESSRLAMRLPLAIEEFLRIVSIKPPPKGAPLQLKYSWANSSEHRLQVCRARCQHWPQCNSH